MLSAGKVRGNLEAVRERIAGACARAGRDPAGVELLAATKYVSADDMGVLAEAGVELVGENTAQALAEKQARWAERFTWDFIGHLQSRKTKEVLPRVRLIHSVESESVLRQLERHAAETTDVLLEVNLSGEPSKDGVAPDDAERFIELAVDSQNVRFAGLMTMPPVVDRPDEARPYFVALRELATRLDRAWSPRHDFAVLSMGTSQDYETAVEEGATIVRIGAVLYA